MRNPKFVIYLRDDGYYFHLRAGNGKIVLISDRFLSPAEAKRAIKRIKAKIHVDQYAEERVTPGGNYYFLLAEDPKQPVAGSRKYGSLRGMRKCLETVRRIALDDPIGIVR